MKVNAWLVFWIVLGLYGVVASIGGSTVAPLIAMYCGYMAGRSVKHPANGWRLAQKSGVKLG